MTANFFLRLRQYFQEVAAVLRGEAKAASIFPNTTDIGMTREDAYAEFLRLHAPSKCNVFLGGFIFGPDGTESRQLDVLVTTDTTPRYNLNNKSGMGKSFSPVEGTLAVVSIKSTLNRHELEDALSGLASIPATPPITGKINPALLITNYADWPYKVIFASDGISVNTLVEHLNNFYANRQIPDSRKPNVIHVAGKYVIFRSLPGMGIWDSSTSTTLCFPEGTFHSFTRDSDLQGLLWVLDALQERATVSNHILYSYGHLMNDICGIPDSTVG